jgi:hypothetical protein
MTTTTATTQAAAPSRRFSLSRLAGAGGFLFVALLILGDDYIAGESPSLDASRADVASYLADQNGDMRQWVGRLVALAGFGCLFLFAARLSAVLRRAGERAGALPGVVLGCAIVTVTVALGYYAALTAPVLGEEGFDPELARLLFYLAGVGFLLAWVPMAVLAGATAVAVLRTGVLPRWFGWASGIQAVAYVIGIVAIGATYAGYFGIVLGFLWLIVASVVLVRYGD